MQYVRVTKGVLMPNQSVRLSYRIPETGYCGDSGEFASLHDALKALKRLDGRQIILSNGTVVSTVEHVVYSVKPSH